VFFCACHHDYAEAAECAVMAAVFLSVLLVGIIGTLSWFVIKEKNRHHHFGKNLRR